MSEQLEQALAKERKAKNLFNYSKRIFYFYLFGVTIFLIVQSFALSSQVQNTLEQQKRDNAEQHARTQQYIRCIADTLLTPLSGRTEINFDNCSNDKDSVEKTAPTSSTQSPTNPPAPSTASEPQTTILERSNDAPVSAPPDNPPVATQPTPSTDPNVQQPQSSRSLLDLNINPEPLLTIPQTLLDQILRRQP